jgi:hypothetical protein
MLSDKKYVPTLVSITYYWDRRLNSVQELRSRFLKGICALGPQQQMGTSCNTSIMQDIYQLWYDVVPFEHIGQCQFLPGRQCL